MRNFILTLVVVAVMLLTSGDGLRADGSLGLHMWRLDPYCDVVVFDVEGESYALTGDSGCSGDPTLSAAFGSVVFHPNGQVGLGFSVIYRGAIPAGVDARVSGSTLSGNWIDDLGLNGQFIYLGQASRTSSSTSRRSVAGKATGGSYREARKQKLAQ